MHNHSIAIRQTRNWLQKVVIAHQFCPFAKREFDSGRIHFDVISATDIEEQLTELISYCKQLDAGKTIETTLLIFTESLADFDDYLDFIELATALLHKQGYEGIYQLASFHPDYCFADSEPYDASNFTNRSPYPMLHLLRESSIEKALEKHPDPEAIPQRNIDYANNLGRQYWQDLLEDC